MPQGTLRKVPLFWSVGSVVLAAGAGSAAGVRGGSCQALHGSWQEGSRAGGAVVSCLDSLWLPSCAPPSCLPALMSILPTGGFLRSVVAAD